MKKLRFGSQIFGLKKELTEDMAGTFEALHAMGYSLLEPLMVVREKQENGPMNFWAYDTFLEAVKLTNEAGLTMVSAHISTDLHEDPEKIAAMIRRMTEVSEVRFFVFGGMFTTAAEARAWAELLNRVQERTKDCAVLLYHNHGDDFARLSAEEREGEDVYAMDAFFRYADPSIGFEPDFGWSYFAGVPFEDMKKYASRIRLIHLKDFMRPGTTGSYRETDENSFPAIGEGNAYNPEVFTILNELPGFEGCIFVDQDHYPKGMLIAMEKGIRNASGWAEGAEWIAGN